MSVPDFRSLSERTRAMQRRYEEVHEDLGRIEETGLGGGGLVVVTADGTGRLRDLRIDPSLTEPGSAPDSFTLADYILEACNAALDAVTERRTEKLGAVTDGLRGVLEGMRSATAGGAAALAERGIVVRQPDRPAGGIPWGSGR